MKKLLLIGDFRDCLNYGAIATTDALLKLIDNVGEAYEIKTITYRSFLEHTPNKGWPDTSDEYLKSLMERPILKRSIKRILYCMGLLNFYNSIQQRFNKAKYKNPKDMYHIPVQYKEFDSYIENHADFLKFENDQLEWADIVLINAEGSIVKGTDEDGIYRIGGLYCLFMAYWAIKLHKPCYMINHTVDPQNRDIFIMIQNIYPHLSGIIVREPKSKEVLERLGITNVQYYPDALFTYTPQANWKPNDYVLNEIDFSKPYICLGDSSGLNASGIQIKWDVVKVYTELIAKLKEVCPQIVFIDGFSGKNEDILKVIRKNHLPSISLLHADYENLYYVLGHSKLFISGRWHSSILSLLAGTPILLWGSDSHKTEALYEMMDYPYRFFDINSLPINIDDLILEAKKILNSDNQQYIEKVHELSVEANKNVYMLNGQSNE